MATTAGSAAQPKWMPGHLNRETRRLRLSRGGGAWESPFGPFIVRRFRLPFFQSSFLRVPSIYTTLARILDIKPKPDHCRSIESSTRARCNTRLSTRNVDLTFFFFLYRVAHSRAIGYIWRGKLTGRNVPLLINL